MHPFRYWAIAVVLGLSVVPLTGCGRTQPLNGDPGPRVHGPLPATIPSRVLTPFRHGYSSVGARIVNSATNAAEGSAMIGVAKPNPCGMAVASPPPLIVEPGSARQVLQFGFHRLHVDGSIVPGKDPVRLTAEIRDVAGQRLIVITAEDTGGAPVTLASPAALDVHVLGCSAPGAPPPRVLRYTDGSLWEDVGSEMLGGGRYVRTWLHRFSGFTVATN